MSDKIFLCPYCGYKHSVGMIMFTEKCVSCHKTVDMKAWIKMPMIKEANGGEQYI